MALPDGLILEIAIEHSSWQKDLPDHQEIVTNALEQIVKNTPEGQQLVKFSHLELNVILCDDAFIKTLNSDFRSQDKATNVLSFEGLDPKQAEVLLRSEQAAPDHPLSLGDVYIAYEVMTKEAAEAGISLMDHFTHLVIHGILHLLGYDHIEEGDAEIMEALETKLLKNLAIDDPYAA